MNRAKVFFSVALLATLSLTALPQTKAKARVRSADRPVTVTLVRWPYT